MSTLSPSFQLCYPLSHLHTRSCGHLWHLKLNPPRHQSQHPIFPAFLFCQTWRLLRPWELHFSQSVRLFLSPSINPSFSPSLPTSFALNSPPFPPFTNLDTTVVHMNYHPTFQANLYPESIISKTMILKIGLKLSNSFKMSFCTIFPSTRLRPLSSLYLLSILVAKVAQYVIHRSHLEMLTDL